MSAPEDSAELCQAASACEVVELTDRCGVARTVDCGACSAPLACVSGVCREPVCATSGYTYEILAISEPNTMEGTAALSADGDTLIRHLANTGTCAAAAAEILDADPPGSTSFVRNTVPSAALGFANAVHALAADGLTLYGIGVGERTFIAARRSARGLADFVVVPGPFDLIHESIASDAAARLEQPTLSPDQLVLYYAVKNTTDSARAGIYESIRASATEPFPVGTRLSDDVQQDHNVVVAVSADHMTLFLDTCRDPGSGDCWYTELYTRRSRNEPFTNPNAPAAAPRMPIGPGFMWGHVVSADCARMFAVVSPGGCIGQDIALVTRQ